MNLPQQKAPLPQATAPRYTSTVATKRITATGKLIDFISPKAEDINLEDIAEALSKQCRFGGHTVQFYSTAQHLCFVHDLCPIEHRPWALLHRAHEAYMGHIPESLKVALHALGGKLALDVIANRFDTAIATAFGIEWPQPDAAFKNIRYWSRVALNTERYDLLDQRAAHHGIWGKDLPRARPGQIAKPWNWSKSIDQFVQRFEALNLPCGAGA